MDFNHQVDNIDYSKGIFIRIECQQCKDHVNHYGAFVEEGEFGDLLPLGWNTNCYRCIGGIILCNKCISKCSKCNLPMCHIHMKESCENNHNPIK